MVHGSSCDTIVTRFDIQDFIHLFVDIVGFNRKWIRLTVELTSNYVLPIGNNICKYEPFSL